MTKIDIINDMLEDGVPERKVGARQRVVLDRNAANGLKQVFELLDEASREKFDSLKWAQLIDLARGTPKKSFYVDED
jgi:hypothetical protein